jgi:hypothetical protein
MADEKVTPPLDSLVQRIDRCILAITGALNHLGTSSEQMNFEMTDVLRVLEAIAKYMRGLTAPTSVPVELTHIVEGCIAEIERIRGEMPDKSLREMRHIGHTLQVVLAKLVRQPP